MEGGLSFVSDISLLLLLLLLSSSSKGCREVELIFSSEKLLTNQSNRDSKAVNEGAPMALGSWGEDNAEQSKSEDTE